MTRGDFFRRLPLAGIGALLGLRASDDRIEIDGKTVLVHGATIKNGLVLNNCTHSSITHCRISNDGERAPILVQSTEAGL
jgi:hypothetical protein